MTSFRARTPSRHHSLREGTLSPPSGFTLRVHAFIPLNALGQNRCWSAGPRGPAVGCGLKAESPWLARRGRIGLEHTAFLLLR